MRVASVPQSHVYVRHLSHPMGVDAVVRLPDPVPADGRIVPGGWWPPLMLEPSWIERHHNEFDVFHVHFGFDAVGSEILGDVVHALERHDKPLVYTVHDLRNPHHPDPAAHTEQQNILVSAAQSLITLTPGAATTVERRWGRRALVAPHPHVVESARIQAVRKPSTQFVVAVHVKSLRANMDPLPVLHTLVSTITTLPHARLQINVHDEIFDENNHWFSPRAGAAIMAFERFEHVDVRVHPYFSEDQLWEYLSAVDVSVLPYRFGTHSGWLEACFDLGTAVIAPSCGFYDEQRPCGVFGFTEDYFDSESLDAAVRTQHARWATGDSAPRADWATRRAERVLLAEAHQDLYRQLSS
ncbi:glycosyltransferase family 1 protein [Mycobacterium sp. 236(2023)]|uniref:glycosyltransferase family 1 protein n=1 Tax=Mycobacterium sp. 236(2023) TaxID=3038163 RepID=UPI002414DF52|nr:glycosyltransferase family 1 protein [Mycobacterium sp. 236(2023)]MDG4664388.1 glycosyltransferase family 1 protein [Mycobacterium sp. 236(2023)]